MRSILLVTSTIVIAVALVSSACDNAEEKCAVDRDCPPGTICREGICGAPSGTGPATDAAADTAPVEPPPGSNGSSSGTTSSGGGCGDLYAICAVPFDCCVGLTCTNGTCR